MVRPGKPYCVYRAVDADGETLYIGVTKNLASRLNNHRRAVWFRSMVRLAVERFDTASAAGVRETELIASLHPPFNRVRGVYWDGLPEYIPLQPANLPAFVVEIPAPSPLQNA